MTNGATGPSATQSVTVPMCSGFYQYQTEQSRRMVLLKSKMPDLAPFPAALECDFVIEEPGNCFWQLGVNLEPFISKGGC